MTSHLTQDSGIHTMSSRRESALSDNTIQQLCLPTTTTTTNYSRKANSDCLPYSKRLPNGRMAQSMEQINKQLLHDINHLSKQLSNCDLKPQTSQCSCHDLPPSISQCQTRYSGETDGVYRKPTSNTSSTLSCHSQKKSEKPQKAQRLLQLCSQRLLAKTHRTENSILHILEDGEVVVELMRKKGKLKRVLVCEVLRISSDGTKIILYEPNGGKGAAPGSSPVPLPPQGGYEVFSIENLPEIHWNKYMHAYQFVALVKEKTPKVTCYSDKIKCVLMENLTDFEVSFYEGGSVTKSSLKGVTFLDTAGTKYNFQSTNECKNLTGTLEYMWNQSQEAVKHCLTIEEMLAKVNGPNFPIIIGRRPNSAPMGKENQTHTMMPSFAVSVNSTNAATSFQSKTTSTTGGREKRVSVPGIGTASQLPDGEVHVKYMDGSQLWLDGKHRIKYFYPDGNLISYSDKDNIPRPVKDKLEQMPKILKYLMPSTVSHKFRL